MPAFRRTNTLITAVWAAAVAVPVAVKAALISVPGMPQGVPTAAGILAHRGALRFTRVTRRACAPEIPTDSNR